VCPVGRHLVAEATSPALVGVAHRFPSGVTIAVFAALFAITDIGARHFSDDAASEFSIAA
jgi:hypothetical protein